VGAQVDNDDAPDPESQQELQRLLAHLHHPVSAGSDYSVLQVWKSGWAGGTALRAMRCIHTAGWPQPWVVVWLHASFSDANPGQPCPVPLCLHWVLKSCCALPLLCCCRCPSSSCTSKGNTDGQMPLSTSSASSTTRAVAQGTCTRAACG
jgi:hypothetical protein